MRKSPERKLDPTGNSLNQMSSVPRSTEIGNGSSRPAFKCEHGRGVLNEVSPITRSAAV